MVVQRSAPLLLRQIYYNTPYHIPGFELALESRCYHVYCTSLRRSTSPELDERPSKETSRTIEATCQQCRMHISLIIDFQQSSEPCPSADFPLHYFENTVTQESKDTSQLLEFACASATCDTKLTVEFRGPTLSPSDVVMLTDPVGLTARSESAQDPKASEPNTPVQALSTFRSYIDGTLTLEEIRRIPLKNRRFRLALGNDASELLLRLGFVFEPAEGGDFYSHWRLPGPGPFLNEDQRTMLWDVHDELSALISQTPDAEKSRAGEPTYRPPPGFKDMERLLGCLDCKCCCLCIWSMTSFAVISSTMLFISCTRVIFFA